MAEPSTHKRQQKLILIAAVVIAGLWFAGQIISMLLLLFLAVVLALVLNAPTMWLMSKRIPRTGAALIVFFTMLIFLVLIAWLVVPKIAEQVNLLLRELPNYIQNLSNKISGAFDGYPSIQEKLSPKNIASDSISSAASLMGRIGKFSLSIIGTLLILILFFGIVAYMLINPAPIIQTYLELFSEKSRTKAANALAHSSQMLIGWMWSNLIVGFIEAALVWIFLTIMKVPGVWVWAGLALFSELIPKLGFYFMAVPPTLIALSIDPTKALWVLIFYIATNEVLGNFVTPKIRASTMNIHPVFTLLIMLVLTEAFGLLGAFAATPLSAFIKAYYVEFYSSRLRRNKMDEQVQAVLKRKVQ